MPSNRLTTHEAAAVLETSYPDVLSLLKAAKIPHERFGGVYLWDGDTVVALKAALASSREEVCHGGQ